MQDLAPTTVRYIKLGTGDDWAAACFAKGTLELGWHKVPHEPCLVGDWDQVTALVRANYGASPSGATRAATELREFYTFGADCVWITFASGHLYWTFAEPAVIWQGGDGVAQGARLRWVRGRWRNTNLKGTPLMLHALSTELTKTGGYRRTICRVEEPDYLLRRLRGDEEPITSRAKAVRTDVIHTATEMIRGLHWGDFKTFVDLIFARAGRHRLSRVGGTQKDINLVLRDAITGETAAVQVKSQAGQPELDDYVARFEATGLYDRVFFICHSPRGALTSRGRNVHIWTNEHLAECAVEAGLFDWLIEKTA